MNLSVQNVQPLDWPTPIQLLQETKVINQTGHPLALAVAIYSIDGTKIGTPYFRPNQEGDFVIPRPQHANPERVLVSLFFFQGEDLQNPAYQRDISLVDLFQNDNYRLG